MKMTKKGAKILDVFIDAVDWEAIINQISVWIQERESRYVCLCNTHSVVTARKNEIFGRAVNAADLSVPDGAPVAWMLRKLGFSTQSRIDGPSLMLKACEYMARTGDSIFLYGGKPDALVLLGQRLAALFPDLKIAGSVSPPFRDLTEEEDDAIVASINASGALVVWVGLGCPKQEIWMATHRDRIMAVMIGVGAAFDYHSGSIRRAPVWMQRAGLEWFFRLLLEPRRLWRRYLVNNSLFLFWIAKQILSVK